MAGVLLYRMHSSSGGMVIVMDGWSWCCLGGSSSSVEVSEVRLGFSEGRVAVLAEMAQRPELPGSLVPVTVLLEGLEIVVMHGLHVRSELHCLSGIRGAAPG